MKQTKYTYLAIILVAVIVLFFFFYPFESKAPDPFTDTSLPTELEQSNITHSIENDTYHFQTPDDWQLVGEAPDRAVDRYRYENGVSVLTISVYENEVDSFAALLERRYGSGSEYEVNDFTLNNYAAQIVTAKFLDIANGSDFETRDVFVRINDTTYISLNGQIKSVEDKPIIEAIQASFK